MTENDIEAMVLHEQSKTSAREAAIISKSTVSSNRGATLSPSRKKKKKKRVGRVKRRGSGDSSIRSMRSIALPTIEESDSESILTNGSSHTQGSYPLKITMMYRNEPQKEQKADEETVAIEMGTDDACEPDISDTSESSSSREEEEDHCEETNKLHQKQQPMKRIEGAFRKRRLSLVVSAVLLFLILIAGIFGGIAGSKSSSKQSSLPIASEEVDTPTAPSPVAPTTGTPTASAPLPMTTPTSSPIASPIVEQRPNPMNFQSMYINAGGEQDYVDRDGRIWSPDGDFAEPIYQDCGNPRIFPNTFDRQLYCRERYGIRGDALRYNFRIPRGEYQLVLHFAEIFHQEAGKRVMDIYINNEMVQAHFDIFKEARGGFRALQIFYDVEVMSGLSIRFEPKPGSDNAKVNAIEVHHISKARDPLEYDVVNDETARPVMSPTDAPTRAPSNEAPVAIPQSPPRPQHITESSSIFINAGSSQPTLSAEGEVWTSDRQLPMWVSSGNVRDDCGAENAIGCSYRFFPRGSAARYEVPVPNGEYEILLQFAESFHENQGDRIFDIFVQNMNLPFRRNYDILEVTGGKGLVATELARAEVRNDMLTIAFERVEGDPLICGIVIIPM